MKHRLIRAVAVSVLLGIPASVTGAHSSWAAAPSAGNPQNCHARNYQPGNCKKVPPGKGGQVPTPGPKANDKPTVITVPATKHGLDLTTNQVTPPKAVKNATAAVNISAVDPKTNAVVTTFNPPLHMKADPKYQACSYNEATGTCTPLKTTGTGEYVITKPGTVVLVPSSKRK